jgi:hypothetical protein
MPKLEYFLVCESVSTDQETNRVSLFNILEEVQVLTGDTPPQLGVSILQFIAFSCWNREPGDEDRDLQLIVRLHVPGNEERVDFPLNFHMDRPRHRVAMRFQGLPKAEPGDLKFELLLNGEHVAWHTVQVRALANEPVDKPET